jgi:hypothetical protein
MIQFTKIIILISTLYVLCIKLYLVMTINRLIMLGTIYLHS